MTDIFFDIKNVTELDKMLAMEEEEEKKMYMKQEGAPLI